MTDVVSPAFLDRGIAAGDTSTLFPLLAPLAHSAAPEEADKRPVAGEATTSIIPDPGPAPTVTPINEPFEIANDISNEYSIGAGETVFVVDAGYPVAVIIQFGGSGANFTNNGTIWLENSGLNGFMLNEGFHNIVNNGVVYIHTDEGGVRLTNGINAPRSLINHGSMYFISESGGARALLSPDYDVRVENYGLIAVQALAGPSIHSGPATGVAIGFEIGNTINLVNHTGAQLLVEGTQLAIGVSTFAQNDLGGPIVDNRGMIDVRASDPDGLSIGIDIVQPGYVPSIVVNSGTIRADFAIYARNSNLDILNTQEFVRNLAGGVLDGHVFLGIGNDELTNDGSVVGNVWMGAGDDLYTGAGTVSGVVDMGFGNDDYAGGEANDRVIGGRGEDTLTGNGGRDILVGGFGNDIITGGLGNDTLIGEWGDDTIHTQGADFVEGGIGDDRVVLGDYRFEAVFGGAGIDTLEFRTGTRNFDLAAIVSTGRVQGFEILQLQANQQLIVDAAAVEALVDKGEPLRILGAASSTVLLEGNWVQQSDVSIGDATFHLWTNGEVELLLQPGVGVEAAGSQSYGGLDAIAGGTRAARLGDAAGVDYSEPVSYLADFGVGPEGFTVAPEEVFFANGNYVFITREQTTITNNGVLESIAVDFYTAYGILSEGRGTLINNGTINVQALQESDIRYASIGIEGGGGTMDEGAPLENNGDIVVYSRSGVAMGIYNAQQVINRGLIAAVSETGRALGVSATYGSHVIDYSQIFFNTGVIYAESGGFSRAVAFQGDGQVPETYVATGVHSWGSLTNDGEIWAVLSDHADQSLETVGVYINTFFNNADHPATLTNYGLIVGTNAVVFEDTKRDGTPAAVINNGLMIGDVIFTDGADRYDGTNGEIRGVVYGFGGADTMIGGREADIFNGGLGNDTIDGGANIDTFIVSGNRRNSSISQISTGVFRINGPDGVDVLTGIEYLQFDDRTIRLLPGSGVTVNFSGAAPDYQSFMENIRDFDGNDLGGDGFWVWIGAADVNGDGDVDQLLVNREIGRFATVGTTADGLVYFADHGWAGETRVAGIYIDPLVQSGEVEAGSDFDSQRRFENDLLIDNISRVLGAGDYDGDGLQEVYFALADGTAYLHAYMHADGNIRYANYQSQQQVIDFLTANGYDASTWAGWFPDGQELAAKDSSATDVGESHLSPFERGEAVPDAYGWGIEEWVPRIEVYA